MQYCVSLLNIKEWVCGSTNDHCVMHKLKSFVYRNGYAEASNSKIQESLAMPQQKGRLGNESPIKLQKDIQIEREKYMVLLHLFCMLKRSTIYSHLESSRPPVILEASIPRK